MPDYENINLRQVKSQSDPFTEDRYRQFLYYFPQNARTVLDVGCNTGRGGKVLNGLEPGLSILGMDCVKQRLNSLPAAYDGMICCCSTQIDVENESFDVIVAGEFIEHLETTDIKPTLLEFLRILKVNGRLLLTTPNPNYIRLKFTGRQVIGGSHLSQHCPKELCRKMQEIGFANVKTYGSGKVTYILGRYFPILSFYGSYLVSADKNSNRKN